MVQFFYVEFFYMYAIMTEGLDINLLNNKALIYLA